MYPTISVNRSSDAVPGLTSLIFTLVAVAVSFAWLGVEDPSRWQASVVLYNLGCKFDLCDMITSTLL